VQLERTGIFTPRLTATLLRPNMRLDLGGIAKGYALAESAKVLRHAGVSRFLVSGGGDLVVGESPPGETGWRIEVAALDVPGAPPPRVLRLRNTSLVTSGDFFQRAEIGGVRYSHIVDPRTGVGLTDHSLVTLIGSEAMTVDAVSKLVSVFGPERGLELLARRFPGLEAMVVRQPSDRIEVRETPGFRSWLAR
jgi:thiamine biosynthesis lipoprotein